MGDFTRDSRQWLDRRYQLRSAEGIYQAHQPIYGLGQGDCESDHVPRVARTFQILRTLARTRFATLLDVGGGEGWLCHLVRTHLGAEAFVADLSVEAGCRAHELFAVEAVAVDAARLPFADAAFDVVVCSEVLEHVEWPVETMLELARVARRLLLITTEELDADSAAVGGPGRRRDMPHAERNVFAPDDFRLVYGSDVRMRSQFLDASRMPRASHAAVEAWLARQASNEVLSPYGCGVIAEIWKEPAARRAACMGDAELLQRLLTTRIEAQPLRNRVHPGPGAKLRHALVCPGCRQDLQVTTVATICPNCARSLPVDRGVPVLGSEELPDPDEAESARRLRAVWPEDAERAAAVLALRRRLSVAATPPRSAWDFDEPEERAEWQANEQIVDGRSLGDDPWLISPRLARPATAILGLRVTLRVDNPAYAVDAAEGQVFWLSDWDVTLAEVRSVRFPVRNDGLAHTYDVPLASAPAWPRQGRVMYLRLDPVNGPGTVEVRRIELIER